METYSADSKVEQSGTDRASAIDAKGRRITVRRLGALQVYRLTKVLGAAASNPASADMATLAATVCAIDSTDFAFPTKELDVEFLIQQLDFHGIAAAAEALQKFDAIDKAELDAAKNSASDPHSD